jgi:hypothetical protein
MKTGFMVVAYQEYHRYSKWITGYARQDHGVGIPEMLPAVREALGLLYEL